MLLLMTAIASLLVGFYIGYYVYQRYNRASVIIHANAITSRGTGPVLKASGNINLTLVAETIEIGNGGEQA